MQCGTYEPLSCCNFSAVRGLRITVGHIPELWLLGLNEDGDPYAAHNEEKFIDDMSLWPLVKTI